MRGAGVLSAVVVVAAVALGAGELLAKVQTPVVVQSMTVRPDLVQLQSATWEWLRTTATSTPFIAGTVLGVIFGEVGRFLLRWLARAIGLASSLVGLVMRYRLIVVGALAAIYYVVTYHVLA